MDFGLHIEDKSIKLFQEKVEGHLCDLRVDKGFLEKTYTLINTHYIHRERHIELY